MNPTTRTIREFDKAQDLDPTLLRRVSETESSLPDTKFMSVFSRQPQRHFQTAHHRETVKEALLANCRQNGPAAGVMEEIRLNTPGPEKKSSAFDELLIESVGVLKSGSQSRIALNEKAICLVGLAAACMLDRMGRAAVQADSSHLSRARKIATAALIDCEVSEEALEALCDSLASERFIDLVNGDSGTALIKQAKDAFHQTRKVHAITNHIVRCAVYPDPRNRGAIEDAKVFVQKWDQDCGISKISKIWERYRLAAPFIYAFHLEERSFRPLDAVSSANVINWARAVVARQGRIQRILGHGAFAVDVLARTAKGQRQADFIGIKRITPPVRPFSSEERSIMDSIDRAAPLR